MALSEEALCTARASGVVDTAGIAAAAFKDSDPCTDGVVCAFLAVSSANTEIFICLAPSGELEVFLIEADDFERRRALAVSSGRTGTESVEIGRRYFVVGGGKGIIDFWINSTSSFSVRSIPDVVVADSVAGSIGI